MKKAKRLLALVIFCIMIAGNTLTASANTIYVVCPMQNPPEGRDRCPNYGIGPFDDFGNYGQHICRGCGYVI